MLCWLPLPKAGERLLQLTERQVKYYVFLYFIDSVKPLTAALPNPFRRGARGWGTLGQQNHAAGGGNGSILVGMFVCLCLASQKPSKREFFVPARTDLGIKLLTAMAMGAHERPLFNKLLW
jgi:hypothetical protein